jgi:hypothetical protein
MLSMKSPRLKAKGAIPMFALKEAFLRRKEKDHVQALCLLHAPK